jgi:putative two-component system response regulator
MKILVADDDEIIADLVEHTLVKAGYSVTKAANGREALHAVTEENIQLVVSDWEMPLMSGVEFCREIRSRDMGGYVYVILLTSRHTTAERVQGLQAGADDFMGKPFDAAELLARVRSGERVLSLETRDVAIFALARLAESRDPETGAHLERVQQYSRRLAQELAADAKYHDIIDSEFIRLIYLTSPLHDIGKVGIPDSVLLKPGPLTKKEVTIMRAHSSIGAETLDAALRKFPEASFLRMARDIAASHHEWFDGTGYPNGLKGNDIPLSGRLVALADVYDALTTKRVYKESFSHHIARSIILEEAGTHFDPEIVEAFLRAEEDFIRIRQRLSEASSSAATSTKPGEHNERCAE